MHKCIIMRGIPGSGKSTYAENEQIGYAMGHTSDFQCRTFSADHFFLLDGQYRFDPSKLGEAHNQCLRRFTAHVSGPLPTNSVLFVDNTNITVAEIAPYAQLALAFGFELEILTLEIDPEIAFGRQVHGAPLHTLFRMHFAMKEEARRFQPWWEHHIRSAK